MGSIGTQVSAKASRQAWAQFRSAIACVAISVLGLSGAAAAEAPYQVAWSRQIGTSSRDEGRSVAVDATGNAYITGWTEGSLAGTNAGYDDSFLAKYDALGNLLWSRQIGTSGSDDSYSVAVDASGNAYISGWTYGSLGGTSAGNRDAFLVKYDGSGNLLWSRQIGTSTIDESHSVAVDASGNAYITGCTYGDLAGAEEGYPPDAFLIKYDGSGNLLWSRQIGSAGNDPTDSVAVDASGNAYISGHTNGSLGGTNQGSYDAFLVKCDGSGNVLWSRQIGTLYYDQSWSVAVDTSGNAYISGQTQGILGATNPGSVDAFLLKYDGSGNLLWSRQIGTSSYDASYSVAVDASGNAYISGLTVGSLGGTNAGEADAFLLKYDGLGNLLWSQQIGTPLNDISYSVAVDASGNAYISGFTNGSLCGTNAGGEDAFLVKFVVPEPATLVLLGAAAPFLLKRKRKSRRCKSGLALGACLPLCWRRSRQGLALIRRRPRPRGRNGMGATRLLGAVLAVTAASAAGYAQTAEVYWYVGFDLDQATNQSYIPSGRYHVLVDHLAPLGYTFTESDAPVDTANLNGYEVLVISQSSLGLSMFTDEELGAIDTYVRGGGGLLLLSECYGCSAKAKAQQVADLWEGAVSVSQFSSANVRSDRIEYHPSVAGVGQVYLRYSAWIEPGDLTPYVWDHQSDPMLTAGRLGNGRVVHIADSDLFSKPPYYASYLDYADNRQLAISTFGYLVAEPATPVGIDIKPGSDPNSINLMAHGILPVAILGAEDLDVSEIDQATLVLGGASPVERGKSGNLGALEDVNDDGFLDLMLRFPIPDLSFDPGAAEAELTGELLDGTPILGSDSVRLLMPGDANLDGLVDGQDFSLLKANFGKNPPRLALGDFNEDGVIDGQDFTILKTYFGQGSPSAANPIPEPGSAVLLVAGALAVCRRRTRR